jgi:hypothetical protein
VSIWADLDSNLGLREVGLYYPDKQGCREGMAWYLVGLKPGSVGSELVLRAVQRSGPLVLALWWTVSRV